MIFCIDENYANHQSPYLSVIFPITSSHFLLNRKSAVTLKFTEQVDGLIQLKK